MQVLGTVKNAALVIFCVIFLRETVTTLQGTGYTVALAGFAWYQWIKIVAQDQSGPGKISRPALARASGTGAAGP